MPRRTSTAHLCMCSRCSAAPHRLPISSAGCPVRTAPWCPVPLRAVLLEFAQVPDPSQNPDPRVPEQQEQRGTGCAHLPCGVHAAFFSDDKNAYDERSSAPSCPTSQLPRACMLPCCQWWLCVVGGCHACHACHEAKPPLPPAFGSACSAALSISKRHCRAHPNQCTDQWSGTGQLPGREERQPAVRLPSHPRCPGHLLEACNQGDWGGQLSAIRWRIPMPWLRSSHDLPSPCLPCPARLVRTAELDQHGSFRALHFQVCRVSSVTSQPRGYCGSTPAPACLPAPQGSTALYVM